jgi:hypothetical protein
MLSALLGFNALAHLIGSSGRHNRASRIPLPVAPPARYCPAAAIRLGVDRRAMDFRIEMGTSKSLFSSVVHGSEVRCGVASDEDGADRPGAGVGSGHCGTPYRHAH